MSGKKIDETFSTALRSLLVEQVEAPRYQGRWLAGPKRWLMGAGAALVLAAGGGGLAWATGVFTTALPGGQITTSLAPAVTVTRAGTHAVYLGAPPVGANSVTVTLVCLSPGTFGLPDGALICSRKDVGKDEMAPSSAPLKHGQDRITITASAGARWRLIASYASTSTIPWSTNASGQTYGVQNQYGTPDLIAVEATDHRLGYAYASQLQEAGNGGGPPPTSIAQALAENHHGPISIPVYESNGKTQIGVFITDASTGTCEQSKAKTNCQAPPPAAGGVRSTSSTHSHLPTVPAKAVAPN